MIVLLWLRSYMILITDISVPMLSLAPKMLIFYTNVLSLSHVIMKLVGLYGGIVVLYRCPEYP